jgi:hypothetical protein
LGFFAYFLSFAGIYWPQPQADDPPQDSLRPVRAATIIAAAHPTPDSTCIAPSEQFSSHAPHSMQSSFRSKRAARPFIEKTPCGHTSAHRPQPIQMAASYFNVLFL